LNGTVSAPMMGAAARAAFVEAATKGKDAAPTRAARREILEVSDMVFFQSCFVQTNKYRTPTVVRQLPLFIAQCRHHMKRP
jgi:hypothetical protein